MKQITIFIICIILFSCKGNPIKNDNIKIDQDIIKITDQFFAIYATNPDSAIVFCFKSNKWIPPDSLTGIKLMLKSLINQLGIYCSYELITTKKITNSYVLIRFLVKYERQPIRFSFIFYKANKAWQLQHFKYDLDFDTELEDAGKAMLLKDNY